MNVELTHLRCFVAVAEELHFGRAAARLFMTQPPLSRQIQLLERSLGVLLLQRTSRSVSLTPAGQSYYKDALQILKLTEHAATSALRIADGDAGRVTLGFTAVSAYRLIPDLVVAAKKAVPEITVDLKEMVSGQQTRAIELGEIDVGVIRSPYAREGLQTRPIFREPLMLVLSAAHPLACQERIEASALADADFIMYSIEGGGYFHDRINGLFALAGIRPNYVQFIDQTHTILALVRAQVGMAVVPASAKELGFRDLVFRPLWDSEAYAELDLAWMEGQINPVVNRFIEFTITHFEQTA